MVIVKKNDIEIKNKIQYQALNRWNEAGKYGTVLLATGFGKTFVALHALYTMPKGDGKTHLFLAETNERYNDLLENIRKYNILFTRDVCKDYKLEFMCYQSAYKLEENNFGLVIADEIHDSLTPIYSKFYLNNDYDALIGLSAKVNRDVNYDLGDGKYVTKGQILDEIAPVAFKYDLAKAVSEKTSRDLTIHIIRHELDSKLPTVKSGSKNKPFLQTEYKAYKYWQTRYNKSLYIEKAEDRDREIFKSVNKMCNILYNLQSKVYYTKLLLKHLKTKTIVFGNSLDFLYKITENVVSSRNTNDRNWQIRNWFDTGSIKCIASFKKLKQGANLASDLDNCIITSYYSSKTDLEQRIGRLRENGYKGRVFIFVTKDTLETKWFGRMMSAVSNIKCIQHDNMYDCVDFLKNEK